jgi:hypothetical protein
LAFFAVPVGDGEGLGVVVGLWLGEGLVLEVALPVGLGLPPLWEVVGVGVLLGELLGPGDGVAGAEVLVVALGSGLGVVVGVALAAVILAASVASVLDLIRLPVAWLAVARLPVARPAADRLRLAATVAAGRVAQAAVTTGELAPCVAANAPPNIPLLINRMPATVPNIATPPGRWFTGLASVPPSGCGLLWSPLLLTLCITEWAFPVVPIRHLRRQGCQWRGDDGWKRHQIVP